MIYHFNQDMKQFLELFNPLPGNHYIQVTTQPDETTHVLDELLQKAGGSLSVALYGDHDDSDLQEYKNVKFQKVKTFKHPFRALPRDHDMVILKDIFYKHENQKMILKTTYTTLANTAYIIIMEKKGVMDVAKVMDILENEFEFRAPNVIDVLDEYDLVMAKKMHMWGNGL